jgi:hypothetical protein
MRVQSAAAACLLAVSFVSGCGDCWGDGYDTDCQIVGHLQDGSYDNQGPVPGQKCAARLGTWREVVSAPQDLWIEVSFDAVMVALTVRDVPLGPSEIDLDDTRAAIEGWSGLQGHLSITAASQDCSNGNYECLLAMHATLSVSGNNRDGPASLTEATLDQRETFVRIKTMCAVLGE